MRFNHTTCLSDSQFAWLLGEVEKHFPDWDKGRGRPVSLKLDAALNVTIKYLRVNCSQAFLGEVFGVSQQLVSKVINKLVPVLASCLEHLVPARVEQAVQPGQVVLLDGSLFPCWSWKSSPQLYSGKHKTTGHNHQVLADLSGNLLWVSQPFNGNVHDGKAFKDLNLNQVLNNENTLADKGYIGMNVTTPIKKPKNQQLQENQKQFNKQINQLRSTVERTIAHIKTWRILHTDYRRPLKTYETTFKTVIGLHFLTNTL